MNTSKPIYDFGPIEDLVLNVIVSKALTESVRMKLYDELTVPLTLRQVCAATNTAATPMEPLLELLVTEGVLVRSSDKYFNSPVADEFLVSSSPFYQGELLALHDEFNERTASALPARLRGENVSGGSSDQGCSRAEALLGPAQFAMRGCLQDSVGFIAGLPGFEVMRTMADVGGNHGRYTMALLDLNQSLAATIVDLPIVTPLIEATLGESGYEERVSVAAFDLRHDELSVQAYDLVLVSHVLHMFSDNLADVIHRLAGSLKPGGWFVTQNMDAEADSLSTRARVRELVTRVMGYPTHLLKTGDLEAALSASGLTDFRAAATGPGRLNVVCAARRMESCIGNSG